MTRIQNQALFIAIATLPLVFAGCVDREAQKQAKKTSDALADTRTVIEVKPVEVGTMVDQVALTGQVVTESDSQVGAKNSGRIVALYVKDGEFVRAGQVIARQESGDQQVRVRQAMAAVQSARSQLLSAEAEVKQGPKKSTATVESSKQKVRAAQAALDKLRAGARTEERAQARAAVDAARSNRDTAKREMERNDELLRQGAISKAEAERTQNAYEAALNQYAQALENERMMSNGARKEDIAAAEATLRQAQETLKGDLAQKGLDVQYDFKVSQAKSNYDSALDNLTLARGSVEDSVIRSPFSGQVSGKPLQVGTYIGPGTAVVRLIGGTGVTFEADVPENLLSQVQVGNGASVKFASLDQEFAGKIVSINPQGSAVGRVFKAKIGLDGDTKSLRAGMFGKVSIATEKHDAVPIIPVSAIVKRDGKNYAFIRRGSKAKLVEIQVVLTQKELAEVKGLESGDLLIVKGQDKLVDNSKIKVAGDK